MTKFLPALGVFLLWSLFAIVIHEYVGNSLLDECAISHNTTKDTTESIEETELENSEPEKSTESKFIVSTADGNSIFNFENGFEIDSTNGNVVVPSSLSGIQDSVYSYLNTNQNQELLITVNHLESETNYNGNHLGILRGQALEKLFTDAGVNPNKITTEILASDYDYNAANKNYNAVSLQFNTISNDRIVEVEKSIANKILYSNFAQKTFLPDRKLIAYTIELKNYLAKYPSKKVFVVGHTDSVGTNNYAFGLGRANNVKDYLISQGISAAIIEASSKGEDEPIATNDTDEGRGKNRRIEITIK